MKVAVIGAGAWGTTLASLLSARADTTLWAREPEVVASIREMCENVPFLPGLAEIAFTAPDGSFTITTPVCDIHGSIDTVTGAGKKINAALLQQHQVRPLGRRSTLPGPDPRR